MPQHKVRDAVQVKPPDHHVSVTSDIVTRRFHRRLAMAPEAAEAEPA